MDIVGLVMTVVLGVLSVIVTWILFRKSSKSESDTQKLIKRITGLFGAAQQMGIVTAHENREIALSDKPPNLKSGRTFVSRIENDSKLVVIGSSLLGLRLYVPHLTEKLTARVVSGFENKFMVTHPCYSVWREKQEDRKHQQIEKEIEETVDFLRGCGVDLKKSLQFYRGTPTSFVIITTDSMLVNPYPYQTEAYKCFCLEVRRQPRDIAAYLELKKLKVPLPHQVAENRRHEFESFINERKERDYDYRLNRGPDIYSQFYWYHYVLPWFSAQAVTFEEYETKCKGCPCLTDGTGYMTAHCRLRTTGPKVQGTDDKPCPTIACNTTPVPLRSTGEVEA